MCSFAPFSRDDECVAFLRWALPLLHMRWSGFRKVRKQVCRRIRRRAGELGLPDLAAYHAYLERHPQEWGSLDEACRVTISRFFRDRKVFECLAAGVLPDLTRAARNGGRQSLHGLSIGCASGEEVYSLALLWRLGGPAPPAGISLRITAIDSHPAMLERARRGCYPAGCLKDVPKRWRLRAFEITNGEHRLRDPYRRGISFEPGDVRDQLPAGPFDLVLCRNLVFTYFDVPLQQTILRRLHGCMHTGAALVIGGHESIPDADPPLFRPWESARAIFRRMVV